MGLHYRLFRPDDLPAIRRLWLEDTTWGALTEAMWDRYVVNAPLDGAVFVVATDDAGDIVGEFAFMPSQVSLGGRIVRACRPAAPIVSRRAPQPTLPNPLHHPAAAMYLTAVKELRAAGVGLLYMVPDPRWVRFLKMFPGMHAGFFPLWYRPLPLPAALPLPAGYVAAPLAAFDARVDRLWEQAGRLHDNLVVRNAEALAWKVGHGDYDVLGVERDGELVGLVASRRKGDRQWLVCDILAADLGDALRATLAAVTNLAHERARTAPADQPLIKVSLLVTPRMEPVVRELGYERHEYRFPLALQVLDPTISAAELDLARWYVSAND